MSIAFLGIATAMDFQVKGLDFRMDSLDHYQMFSLFRWQNTRRCNLFWCFWM